MIAKLLDLDYKRVCDFENNDMRENLEFFTNERQKPDTATFYAKVVEQCIQYEMDDGSVFENHISLNIVFLVDDFNDNMLDCFCVPPYPFELKTQEDFGVLRNLYEIYRNDLKELMNDEKASPCCA